MASADIDMNPKCVATHFGAAWTRDTSRNRCSSMKNTTCDRGTNPACSLLGNYRPGAGVWVLIYPLLQQLHNHGHTFVPCRIALARAGLHKRSSVHTCRLSGTMISLAILGYR